jgi:DNA-directed RNA polymerase subunit RPC12/RpoP
MVKTCAKCGKSFQVYNTIAKFCPSCSRDIFIQSKKYKPKKGNDSAWKYKIYKGKPGKKKSELTLAKDNAWKYVSRYYRLLYTKGGYGKCYTCSAKNIPIYELDLGHYITRGVAITRYHPDNLKCQCGRCNRLQDGNKHIFRDHLIEELGIDRVLSLEKLSHETGDDSILHHRMIAQEYKEKLKELENKLGVHPWG